jgi:hypothetical protein
MKKQILALAAILGLIVVLAPSLGAGQAVSTLKNVSFQRTANGLDVNLVIEGEFLYQVQVLSGPTRLAVDLSPISKVDARPVYEVNQGGLNAIRTGLFSAQIARVVLDFSGILPSFDSVKTDTGLVLRFSTAALPAAKPVIAAPIREQPVPTIKPVETGTETETGEGPEGFANTMIGAQIGSYQVPSDRFSEIYGKDAIQTFGLSLSRALLQYGGLSLDVEGSIRFYSKTGASTLSQEAATFKMTPISLALRLNYFWKYFQVFVGYGLDWYSYTETSAIADTTGNANGHHFTAGLYLIPPVLDGMLRLKAYYKFTKVTATSNGISVDLGGNEYGVGLSLGFNLFKKGVLSF